MKNRKKSNYTPYNLNISYEQKTYKYVGYTYGDYTTANKGLLLNLRRFYLKKKNKNEKNFKFCNTYSEWETHIKTIIKTDMLNYNDFLHWLKAQKRNTETFLESIKGILIPIYIALFSISNTFYDGLSSTQLTFATCILAVFLAVASALYLFDATENVNFYNDLLEIAEHERKTVTQEQSFTNEENI